MPVEGSGRGAGRGEANVDNRAPCVPDAPGQDVGGADPPDAMDGSPAAELGSACVEPSDREVTGAELTGFDETVRGPDGVDSVPDGGGGVPSVCTWAAAGTACSAKSRMAVPACKPGDPLDERVRERRAQLEACMGLILLPGRPRDKCRRAVRRSMWCLRVRAGNYPAARRL